MSRRLDGGCTKNWLLRIEGGAQRKKWDKGNAIRPAGVEDILSGSISQVVGILHAGDVNQRLRGPVLLQVDVTQSNPPDQALLAHNFHGLQLIGEQNVGFGMSTQIHPGDLLQSEGFEIGFNSGPELIGPLRAMPLALMVSRCP